MINHPASVIINFFVDLRVVFCKPLSSTHMTGLYICPLRYCSRKLEANIVLNYTNFGVSVLAKHCRRFIDRRNFEAPLAGLAQTIIQRAVSTGLYFPLEDMFKQQCRWISSENTKLKTLESFIAGTCAGAVNGIVLNPASSVKVILSWFLFIFHIPFALTMRLFPLE